MVSEHPDFIHIWPKDMELVSGASLEEKSYYQVVRLNADNEAVRFNMSLPGTAMADRLTTTLIYIALANVAQDAGYDIDVRGGACGEQYDHDMFGTLSPYDTGAKVDGQLYCYDISDVFRGPLNEGDNFAAELKNAVGSGIALAPDIGIVGVRFEW